ncbi:MAG: GH3 auxin-responsive promoter family protein [Candidatus Bathyarchaeia archaeon]
MLDEKEIWHKYCSFLEKPFSEQVAYSEERIKKHFEKWTKTKTARYLAMKYGVEIKKFEDIPLTSYEDYPILHEFGLKIDEMTKRMPRREERLFDYYSMLFAELKPIIDGWMIDDFGYAAKTSGSTGEPKWIVHGVTALKNYENSCITVAGLMCSESWGETKIKEGDTGLLPAAPIPYTSGWGLLLGSKYFKVIPSLEVAEKITDMRKRLWIILKEIEEGRKPVFAAGVPSFFQMVCRYLKDRASIYREYYSSLKIGFAKFYMLLKWWQSSLFDQSYKNLRDFLPLKGIGIGGVNISPYKDFFVKEFGIEPTNVYGSTEFPTNMYGPPDRKECLLLDLRTGYYEFIDENGNIRRVDELKKGRTYELVGTAIESMLIRYRVKDLFTVVDFRDDGMPYFAFKSRVGEILDFYGYFRITEGLFSKIISNIGLKYFEKWTVAKVLDEKGEHILILMEKPWEYSEEETAKIIFEKMREMLPDFQDYIRDFSVKSSTEIVRVKYLRKGAFLRYSIKKIKEGAEPGQIKPPKIIPPERNIELNLLETV